MINFETKDMNLLYSILNLKLRDEFKNLDDLTGYYGKDKIKILKRMEEAGYYYSEDENQFKRK
ncbi:DUF4250 domain-containing protein [Leptotrichia sp. oral taxon 847]|uniref:DUF4250 domain-containing protein n=1 Tax=Leptotrichia sp. oral taxon 847 TaxID=1785996 RepID=UPI0007680910|nr:DUF4250 domain-containing protein [Leptotrichia sp. oral taxon 847]AMD95567.1 hypothetical protein AXF11_08280 [Leptotrichia sp. oral taxon 847]